jgi:hypothetical protein
MTTRDSALAAQTVMQTGLPFGKLSLSGPKSPGPAYHRGQDQARVAPTGLVTAASARLSAARKMAEMPARPAQGVAWHRFFRGLPALRLSPFIGAGISDYAKT